MARCLRCKAGPEWIEGDVLPEPRETLEQTRARFEQWYKMTHPLFHEGSGRDTTIKHQMWTAWQVAHLGSIKGETP